MSIIIKNGGVPGGREWEDERKWVEGRLGDWEDAREIRWGQASEGGIGSGGTSRDVSMNS